MSRLYHPPILIQYKLVLLGYLQHTPCLSSAPPPPTPMILSLLYCIANHLSSPHFSLPLLSPCPPFLFFSLLLWDSHKQRAYIAVAAHFFTHPWSTMTGHPSPCQIMLSWFISTCKRDVYITSCFFFVFFISACLIVETVPYYHYKWGERDRKPRN